MNKDTVIKVVCNVCEISPEDILSDLRTRDISEARKIIAFVLLKYGFCHTYGEAGEVVGLQSNSAYKSLRNFNELVKYDASFRFRYEATVKALSDYFSDYISD